MNTAMMNIPDFFKIGIMAVLFLALLRYVASKMTPTASA